jgi:multidrug efflux pump subunit AcrB
VEPLIVMTAIPFGFVGAVWGHLLLGHDWTMPSTIGFISLSGIVVNDSIVLVAFIKLRLREGLPVGEALQLAGMGRFRAVFLTSATTVAGLLPIMLETSLQAQFLIPMAVSISFGLMFATVVVLLLVPCLYSILAAVGWTQKIEVAETPS